MHFNKNIVSLQKLLCHPQSAPLASGEECLHDTNHFSGEPFEINKKASKWHLWRGVKLWITALIYKEESYGTSKL